ncbi:response regulator transcription factor [Shewanella intestini]|uniref:Response regulator transcription factor n=1 Tax=Shewanella intestini TaxID=2017544 RepID=A0ABS5I1J2_9GAMM|nr:MULTISPECIES: response regulator transcription factor [Shewanella]MBR9727205.1 response regulator transcription factor [Shewanella intestini]MRG36007.1 response regulator [Shewanella sp. XMDDZSB0408]
MTKILLIEDEINAVEGMHNKLSALGLDVQSVRCAFEAMIKIDTQSFDVILFDLACQPLASFWLMLSQRAFTPVMALAYDNNDEERINAYEQGADDYLPRPFNMRELQLKLTIFSRRFKKTEPKLTLSSIFFDDISCTVQYNNQSLSLTQTEFRLLKYLYDKQGKVVTKQELQRHVLEKEHGKFDRNLDMHVSNTRRKLVSGNLPRELINTVRGQGYSFTFVAA